MPDYNSPPPRYQVMTVGQARQEHSDAGFFTADKGRFCEGFGIEDSHWCYVSMSHTHPSSVKPYPYVSLLDESNSSPFLSREDACRMAWLSYVRHDYLTPKLTLQEIDRVIGRFQREGKL